ncbi:VOC family protein [Sinomonas albida]|uniref:VOC family protein n=1 Tax=Sinomonas albida TaxID=369942 RepID=UPI0010A93BA0|nr:VOC family protein [Sinomonas albida]
MASSPLPYALFPGSAREALTFYQDVFGGELTLHTRAEFGRADEPLSAIAHGMLNGLVTLYGADRDGDASGEPGEAGTAPQPIRTEGLMLTLLGTADPDTLRTWFARLSEGGRVVDEFQERPWGAWDGQVVDRYGLHWLIGFEL